MRHGQGMRPGQGARLPTLRPDTTHSPQAGCNSPMALRAAQKALSDLLYFDPGTSGSRLVMAAASGKAYTAP